jgi:predicted unusual protein kinase regulating ubiquinone biosynthesis (AarF/ABC1/UbiB family)
MGLSFQSLSSSLSSLYHGTAIAGTLATYAVGYIAYVPMVKQICTHLAGINIFYVKFFQWFTSSLRLDDREINQELTEYFATYKDKVPFAPADIDTAALTEIVQEIAATGGTLRLDSTTEPVNSGTVALVFRGQLTDAAGVTHPVAVKVLRTGIQAKMVQMYAHYRRFARFLRAIPGYNIDVFDMICDTKDTFFAQADMPTEAANIMLFHRRFRGHKNIVIPYVYGVTPKGIVMDFLESYALEWQNNDYRAYCSIFTQFLMIAYFIKEIYHGDMHMGNLVFMKDPRTGTHRLGVIDFGVVGTLTVDSQNFIYNLLETFSNNDYKALVGTYVTYVVKLKSLTDPAMLAEITKNAIESLEKHHCTNIYDFSHTHLFLLQRELNRYNLVLDKNINIYLFSVLAMIETLKELSSKDVESNLTLVFNRLNNALNDI